MTINDLMLLIFNGIWQAALLTLVGFILYLTATYNVE